jgi:hypothetical protein
VNWDLPKIIVGTLGHSDIVCMFCLAAMDQELVKDQLNEICPGDDCSIRVIQRVQLSVV